MKIAQLYQYFITLTLVLINLQLSIFNTVHKKKNKDLQGLKGQGKKKKKNKFKGSKKKSFILYLKAILQKIKNYTYLRVSF